MAATLLNSSAGKALLDSMPNSTHVPIQQYERQHGYKQVAHPGDGQRLPVRLDTAFIHKGEEAIQQAGLIQP